MDAIIDIIVYLVILVPFGTSITILLGARRGRRRKAELEREERHKEVQRNISRLERELEVGKWDPARLALELDGYSTEDARWARTLRCGLKAARKMRLAQVGRDSRPQIVRDHRRVYDDDMAKAARVRRHIALTNTIMLGPGDLSASQARVCATDQLGWDHRGIYVTSDTEPNEPKPVRTYVDGHGNRTTIRSYGQ